jgi:hypothetical protein
LPRLLACEQLGGSASLCRDQAAERQALLRWLTVSGLPVLLLLAGLALLGREGWRLWRRRQGPAAPLVAPALALEDVTLLIAGGFVVLGELVAPLLLVPTVQGLLVPLAQRPALQQGLQVLLLYLGVMVAPLTILALLLRPLVPAPPGGPERSGEVGPSRAASATVPAAPPTRKNQRTTSWPAPISAKVP